MVDQSRSSIDVMGVKSLNLHLNTCLLSVAVRFVFLSKVKNEMIVSLLLILDNVSESIKICIQSVYLDHESSSLKTFGF